MDPYSAVIGAVSNLVGTGLQGLQQNQLLRRATEAGNQLKAGKGYNYDAALKLLGLTNKSAYEDVDAEPKDISMSALRNLLERGSGKGLDIQSKVALSQALGRSGAAQNAARKAIMAEYAARGNAAGSGAELADMLGGQQQNYSLLNEATGQSAAAAEQRRLEANVLASRASQQQQQLDQQRAAAIDALRRFNVGARQTALQEERMYRTSTADAMLGGSKVAQQGIRDTGNIARSAGYGINALMGAGKSLWGNEDNTGPYGINDDSDAWRVNSGGRGEW